MTTVTTAGETSPAASIATASEADRPFIWIDGKLLPKSQAMVSVFDHGLLYGDGVFEGIRVYQGAIFKCQSHLDRIFRNAKEMHMMRQGGDKFGRGGKGFPYTMDEVRAAILTGMKLGKQGGLNAAGLLQKWTGRKHASGKDVEKAMAYYRNWYAGKFPDAPPAELPKEDLQKTKYSFDQLFAFLEKDPKGRSGDPKRGKLIFTKANCIKCHRFLNEGETIGPDFTSVRRRFQRKEIIESMVYPSQVISDQYRMVTVVTKDGLVHNGMPITGATSRNTLVLLLPDATRLEIPKRKIDEQFRSKISVMPEGALKNLSLADIADLFAFLETSRFNEVTPRDSTAKTGRSK